MNFTHDILPKVKELSQKEKLFFYWPSFKHFPSIALVSSLHLGCDGEAVMATVVANTYP